MCKYTLKICWTTLFHKNIFHKSHSQNFGGCDVPTNLFSPIYLLLSQSFIKSIVINYQTILLYKNIFHKVELTEPGFGGCDVPTNLFSPFYLPSKDKE